MTWHPLVREREAVGMVCGSLHSHKEMRGKAGFDLEMPADEIGVEERKKMKRWGSLSLRWERGGGGSQMSLMTLARKRKM
jgi:hypothetical protein